MIIRVKHTKNFITVSKDPIADKELSLKAKGLLVFLLGKPDNWTIRVSHLATEVRESRTALYRIIKELLEAGYVERLRRRKSEGQFAESLYVLFENRDARQQWIEEGKRRYESKTLHYPETVSRA